MPQTKSRSRTKSHASRSAPARQIPGWLWLLTGMVLGGFIMFLVHLSELKKAGVGDDQNSERQTKSDTASKPKSGGESSEPETKEESPSELIFEFYDRLKEEQVTVPDYEQPQERAAQITHHYFLQVASFRSHADADKARARLILLNMEASIEKTTLQSGATMYRVIVGPYTNKSKLAKARETLVSNGFEYLTLKRKI